MQLDAALIKEQGVTFAVVAVKPSAITAPDRDTLVHRFGSFWNGVPVVLFAQDSRGGGRYYGRPDLVRFLRSVPVAAMPWRKWTLH